MRTATTFADRLELFFGETSDTLCHIYARLRGPEAAEGLQLTGSLVGPSCLYAQTLPARFEFTDRGPGDSLLAEAVVPEPCFWTPDMPQLYQADVQLRRGDEVLTRATHPFGIRNLGASRRDLYYDNKRWVLRGVCRDKLPPTDLAAWREADTAMVVKNPDDELCQQASRVGVLIVARLKRTETHEIARLGRWPAVAVVAIDGRAKIDASELPPNLLIAQEFPGSVPLRPMPWAQLVLYDECNLPSSSVSHVATLRPLVNRDVTGRSDKTIDQMANFPIPIIVTKLRGMQRPFSAIARGRTACDCLQGRLAGRTELAGCNFAGYIV